MQRDARKLTVNGSRGDRTPDAVLQTISHNLRSGGQPVSASTRRAREFIAARTKTPGTKLQLQQTPTSAFATTRRLRATPGRGWAKPTTPHGAKALQSRNAAITPARARRQSGRAKRETPRDLLRALSRVIPRPEKPEEVAEKEVLEPTVEVPEEDEDSPDEQAPELSFGVDGEDSGFEVEKARRVSDRGRLSLADNSMLGLGLEDIEESSDSEERPVTKLLEESLESDDLQPPEALTFDLKDQVGDTVALRQLMALTRSPESPQIVGDQLTPTANMSFVLDIPDLPPPEPAPRTPIVEDEWDEDDTGFDEGGFDLRMDGELNSGGEEFDQDGMDFETGGDMTMESTIHGNSAPNEFTELGVDFPEPLDARLAQRRPEKKTISKPKKAPRREGLSKGVIKRIASSFLPKHGSKKSRLKRGAVDALVQATDWFMEQVSGDLAAYAEHAGRRKIDESDFLLLAQRQRLLNPSTTLFSLANKYLPRELLREVQGAQTHSKGNRSTGVRDLPSKAAKEAKSRSQPREPDVSVDDTEAPTQKKGRGRPRKSDVSDISATSATSVESHLGKRKRGRPRKSNASE